MFSIFKKKPKVPETFEKAVTFILLHTSDDVRKQIIETSEDDLLCGFHHGYAQALRNNWGLWHGSVLARWFAERGITHADDMSSLILTKVIRDIKGEPFDFDDEKRVYQKHWFATTGSKMPKVDWWNP